MCIKGGIVNAEVACQMRPLLLRANEGAGGSITVISARNEQPLSIHDSYSIFVCKPFKATRAALRLLSLLCIVLLTD